MSGGARPPLRLSSRRAALTQGELPRAAISEVSCGRRPLGVFPHVCEFWPTSAVAVRAGLPAPLRDLPAFAGWRAVAGREHAGGSDVADAGRGTGGGLLPRGTTRLAAATYAAWGALFAVIGARAAETPLPRWMGLAAASAALASAVARAGQIAISAWRGPVVVDFARHEAVLCGPDEADVVRSAALLRGTMGGAGYVWRARLLLPATGAIWAALVASWMLDPGHEALPAWALAVLALLVAGSAVLPARPFYYREASDGCLLLHPEDVWVRLSRFSSRRETTLHPGSKPPCERGPEPSPRSEEAPGALAPAWRSGERTAPQGEGEP